MKYLLDVNVLLAAIWSNHPHHKEIFAWLETKSIVLCPLCQLGFLRISSNSKAMNAPMATARQLLERFIEERKAGWIADDLPVFESHPRVSEEVTDHYLADLAARHNLKLATLDEGIAHPAVELVR